MLRAGQFKMPGSAIELASPWALPTRPAWIPARAAHRRARHPWRRPGRDAALERGAKPSTPEVSGAIYQGVVVVSEGLVRDKDLDRRAVAVGARA